MAKAKKAKTKAKKAAHKFPQELYVLAEKWGGGYEHSIVDAAYLHELDDKTVVGKYTLASAVKIKKEVTFDNV